MRDINQSTAFPGRCHKKCCAFHGEVTDKDGPMTWHRVPSMREKPTDTNDRKLLNLYDVRKMQRMLTLQRLGLEIDSSGKEY